jgi:lipoprotein signal peptidase
MPLSSQFSGPQRPPRRQRKWIAFWPTALAVALVDQVGKLHAAKTLGVGMRQSLVGDLLSLAHLPGTGDAFGILNGSTQGVQLFAFALLSVITTIVIGFFYRGLTPREFGSAAGLGAILGGILSHSIDRIRVGSSIDLFQVGSSAGAMLPEFNLADLAIVLGVVTLIVELLATEMAARASERPPR